MTVTTATDIDFIPPDYVPPEPTYDSLPDGKYKVKGFEWFSLDNNNHPILACQKDGKLVGRLRFKLADTGKDGPPMSVTLGEMALLAKAHDAKVSQAPEANQGGLITQYMIELQTKCQKELEVEVKKGWVNTIPGMDVPQGYFYFHIADITGDNTSGQLRPKDGQHGKYFFITFEIDAGEGGSDTPFKGAQFTELVTYGMQLTEGKLDYQRTKMKDGSLGQWDAAGFRMSKVIRLSAPNIKVGEYNIDNFLAGWRKLALDSHRTLKGNRIKEDKGTKIRLVWNTLEEATGYHRIIEDMGVDGKLRKLLVTVLDRIAGVKATMGETYTFTDAGKEVARQHLSPLKKEGKIAHGSLEELTPDEVIIIMKALWEKQLATQEELDKAIGLGIGIETVSKQEAEDDSPF